MGCSAWEEGRLAIRCFVRLLNIHDSEDRVVLRTNRMSLVLGSQG